MGNGACIVSCECLGVLGGVFLDGICSAFELRGRSISCWIHHCDERNTHYGRAFVDGRSRKIRPGSSDLVCFWRCSRILVSVHFMPDMVVLCNHNTICTAMDRSSLCMEYQSAVEIVSGRPRESADDRGATIKLHEHEFFCTPQFLFS